MFAEIDDYLCKNLKLTVKPPVFGSAASGLPFLGFLIKEKGIYLTQKSKRRVKGRVKEITALLDQRGITEDKAAQRVRSVFAAIALARTNRFRKTLCEKEEQSSGERYPALTV